MRQTQTLTKSLSAGYQMFLCTNISSSLRDISPKLKVNSTFCEHWALFQKERKVGRREEERRKEKKGKERNGYFTPTAISLFRIKILQSPLSIGSKQLKIWWFGRCRHHTQQFLSERCRMETHTRHSAQTCPQTQNLLKGISLSREEAFHLQQLRVKKYSKCQLRVTCVYLF